MAQQTINIGASPNDGTGTPLRTAFQYTNSNFSELYTAVGPSGNNIVVPGSATITGDLTVATSALKVTGGQVGIGAAAPSAKLTVLDTNGIPIRFGDITAAPASQTACYVGASTSAFSGNGNGDLILVPRTSDVRDVVVYTGSGTAAERFRVSGTGIATWSNVGGVAGTAMTLNSTGLGVGASPSQKLHLYSNTTPAAIRLQSASPYAYPGDFTVGAGGFGTPSFYIYDNTNSAFRFVLDTSGNVGIGVTPSAWGSGLKALQVGARGYGSFFDFNNDVVGLTSNLFWTGSAYSRISTSSKYAVAYYHDIGNGSHQWLSSSAAGTNGVTPTMNPNMTLDASGTLAIGTVALGFTSSMSSYFTPVAGYWIGNHATGTASGERYWGFGYGVNEVGSITQNGTTGVLYNITSDYRLKEQVQPLVGGLARVNALKPSVYKWKSDGSNGEGFLAHELAEVVPFAVSGEKDAVNEDGSIKSQGIDMSRVVPILVAAIQELTARVQTLETR